MTSIINGSPRRICFNQHHADGVLTVYPEGDNGVPFSIRRVFTIVGVSVNGKRGNHAHRRRSQLHACLAGRVDVEIRNGAKEAIESLSANGSALLIPPMLWSSFTFEGPSTVLAVFCDDLYDEADYIRDWDEYVRLKRAAPEL
jgi:dTDP-4-dehydrorhamnose 3,5-epimerase-like enzyme